MSGQLPPVADGAETSFEARMAYGDYLHLDEILGAQKPLTRAHDEMLFIVQHQVSELWMRLAIHEIDAARRAVAGDAVQPAFKMLSRVARIFEQLNNAWDVLRTMTPTSSNGRPIIRAGCSISRPPRPCGSTPWRASFPPSHAAKFDAEPSIPSTICRPRSHATSTPTTAILDRSYGPLNSPRSRYLLSE